MNDLAVILVSHHGEPWLRECLASVFAHAGGCALEVVVVNNAEDGTAEVVQEFPEVRFVRCANHGYAHANNVGVATCEARYYLFLNVDTEIRSGSFDQLVAALDLRPSVGMAGVRQLTPDGAVAPTMRYFPTAYRSFAEAIGAERLPFHASWLGERELRLERYDHEQSCDWSSGSFLVVRREVLLAVGLMDERFFLYSEEPDLCLRGKQAGFEMRHLPVLTVLHHGGAGRPTARLAAQDAFSRVQFARKHFSAPHRLAYTTALALGLALRAVGPRRSGANTAGREPARRALRTLLGAAEPPFGQPPQRAVGELEVLDEVRS